MTTTGNTEGERSMTMLKIKEVAERLRVSHDVVNRLVNTGKLPAHHITGKVIRVSEADLAAFLEAAKRNDCNTP